MTQALFYKQVKVMDGQYHTDGFFSMINKAKIDSWVVLSSDNSIDAVGF